MKSVVKLLLIALLFALLFISIEVSADVMGCDDSKIILERYHLDSDKSPWNEFLDQDTTVTVYIPKIVVLANSIDYENAPDFIEFLRNSGLQVISVIASDFESCKEMESIVILGGPDAPEGVGEIVQEALNYCDEKAIRKPGSRKMYIKSNVWAPRQKVVVIAGSNREETKKAHQEKRSGGASESEENEEECLGVDCGKRLHMTCNAIYNSDPIKKMDILSKASESEWRDYQIFVNTLKSDQKTIASEKALWRDIEKLRK
jgi:hypothetical protein